MPQIDQNYIPAFTIETVLLDKDTGAPLTGGIVTFYKDAQRTILKDVYQITGTDPNYSFIALTNPMILSSIGTFEDTMGNPVVPYFYPFDADGNPEYYYVTVESSGNVPQFVRESVPYIPETSTPAEGVKSYINEISNPQFADVYIDRNEASVVYSFTAASLEALTIAPGWDLVVSGTGSVTVSIIAPVGSLNVISNPGTILSIDSTGLSAVRLRQRIYGSPNIFSDQFLSGTMVVKKASGGTSNISLYYSQSDGSVVDLAIIDNELISNDYEYIYGNVLVPQSSSANFNPDAYIDFYIDIPPSIALEITSIQVLATGTLSVEEAPYQQLSNDRQEDFEFHYYKDPLLFKSIPSILTGWDFNLNPAQFGEVRAATSTPDYIWDQLIMGTLSGTVNVDRAVIGAINPNNAAADEAYYMLQYLTGANARKILETKLSVNVSAYSLGSKTTTIRVYLYRAATASSIPTLGTTIGTISSDGTFSLTGAAEIDGWTEIPRGNFGEAKAILEDTPDVTQNFDKSFIGWEITDGAEINDTDKFAIVVTYLTPNITTDVIVNSISVVPGDVPTRPAPQTFDQVLQECQYYYEKSMSNDVTVSTTPPWLGELSAYQIGVVNVGGNDGFIATPFTITFQNLKRTETPTMSILCPSNGLSAQVYSTLYAINAGTSNTQSALAGVLLTNWIELAKSSKAVTYNNNNSFAVLNPQPHGAGVNYAHGMIFYHYIADARLGKVA
jgi:hypothetical protein